MRARLLSIVVVLSAALLSTPVRAGAAETPEAGPDAEVNAAADVFLATYAAPSVDGPALRLPLTLTGLYVDASVAKSGDLSALPFIAGSGRNIPFVVGGALRWHDFAYTLEVPFVQVTTLNVTAIPGGTPIPQDMHQTAISFGDVRLGINWTQHLSPALIGGFGLRARVPTHTTQFRFHLVDGSLATYSFPYYFHVDPTAILGGAFGRFTVVVNQGAVVLAGPSGDFAGQYIDVPTIVFWDAHYAVSYAPVDVVGGSVELGTDIQINHVGGTNFQKLNDVRSVWIAPALQFHAGAFRIDAIARIGLTRGADLFGVLEYAGTSSYTLRVSRTFN